MARKFFVGGNWKCNGTLEKVKKIVVMLNEGAVPSSDVVDRVCDAFEVAGRNVMSTSNTVTTELVAHKYGEDAGKATNESLDAAGHAIGVAWTVFKIRKAMNTKSFMRSSNLAKYGDMTFKDKKKDKKKDMKKDKNDKKECKSKK